ncbi:potassium-transporting ATPase subunit F [Spirosoma endbachense]|nr:potassium-transporting ATPase subunit F [Spirosoma endbachense]
MSERSNQANSLFHSFTLSLIYSFTMLTGLFIISLMVFAYMLYVLIKPEKF